MFLFEDKVGDVLKRYPFLDEVLYMFTDNTNLVYDEAEYTIKEFADMVGADVEDILKDCKKAISKR